MVKKAVILCGGNGTRFLPITKVFPKEMLPIIDRPVIEYHLKECKEAGIKDILIIINKRKDMMKDYFKEDEYFDKLIGEKIYDDMKVTFVYQGDKKGTGAALEVASDFAAGEPIAILYGDDYYIESATAELVKVYNEYNKDVVSVRECLTDEITKYGVMVGTPINADLMACTGIKEKPSLDNLPSRLYLEGRFICKGDIFDRIKKLEQKPNGEYYLTDALNDFISVKVKATHFDLGSKAGYLKAMIYHGLKSEWSEEIRQFIKENM